MLLEEFDEERAIKSWNYAMDKMQTEIKQYKNEIEQFRSENEQFRSENEQFRNEIEQYHNEIEEYHNKLTNVCSENKKNIMQTVSLLREIGKDDDFIIQALVDKYNISKKDVHNYL